MLRALISCFNCLNEPYFYWFAKVEKCVLAYSFTSRDIHLMRIFLSIHFSASDAKFKTHVMRPSICPDIRFPVKT